MQSHRLLVLAGLLLVPCCGLSVAHAVPANPFAVTASNVTMPATGNGLSQFTVTGIPMTGTMSIATSYSGPTTTAKMPTCGIFPPVAYQVTAGGTLSGTIACYPYGAALPASLQQHPHGSGHLPAAGLALAGGLLLGFGLRRRTSRWIALALFATFSLAGLAGISACASGNPMTPGTYQFTIMAGNESSGVTPLGQGTSTTITVTVP